MRGAPHRRTRGADHHMKDGIASFDLAVLGKESAAVYALAMVAYNRGRRIVVSLPVVSRTVGDIESALMQGCLVLEQIYGTCALVRLHSDKESGVASLKGTWARQYAIRLTSTQGFDHEANGDAENAIGELCRLARSALIRVSDEITRVRLWTAAMTYAGQVISSRTMAGVFDPKPFMALMMVPISQKSKGASNST